MILRSLRVTWKSGRNADYTPHARAVGWSILLIIILSAFFSWLSLGCKEKEQSSPKVTFSEAEMWKGCWKDAAPGEEWPEEWECSPGCRMLSETEVCCK